ncbi:MULTISPECIES: hypothetical protein [unclassified Polaromonas]|uniref:hypothetical protein n=2 Tax=Polaromonas TaxID=52972 RepID=UPI0018CBA381|nr:MULTISPECIES: hypothetical protein [unclassified Polaromonas]MBG6115170.1 hypothetical protein [Polaromonas sp. CG_9.2]
MLIDLDQHWKNHQSATECAACNAMRSSSAQTSAIRPEMTIRPAQSGRMFASDSRMIRNTLRGDTCGMGMHVDSAISGRILKHASLLADAVRGLKEDCVAPADPNALDLTVLCANESLSRVIHGTSV